jgi:restriction system protein
MATVLEAAESVLEIAGEPLHVAELTKRMLDSGAWTTSGKTPSATVESSIVVNLKRSDSRFVRTSPRTYGLKVWGLEVAAPAAKSGMTYLEAAEAVLTSRPDREPMSYREITRLAIDDGYLSARGLTPEQTMYVSLITDVERRKERGDPERFIRLPEGLFGLASWSDSGAAGGIQSENREVRKVLHARLLEMHPAAFEGLIGSLLERLGFADVEVTKPSGDDGVDVRAVLVVGGAIKVQTAVQVKRWRSNVQSPVVQQLRGSLGAHDHGLIITTSDFSSGAREEAAKTDRSPVALMNGDRLVDLLVEHEIGVRRVKYELLELVDLTDQ